MDTSTPGAGGPPEPEQPPDPTEVIRVPDLLGMLQDIATNLACKPSDRIKAAKILLDKKLPSLQAIRVEHSGSVTFNFIDPLAQARERLAAEEARKKLERAKSLALPPNSGGQAELLSNEEPSSVEERVEEIVEADFSVDEQDEL